MAGLDMNQGSEQLKSTGFFRGTSRNANAYSFFVALFGGGFVVWWIKSADFVTKSTDQVTWWAAIVAAVVVLLLTIYYMLNDMDAPEEKGDNVYYLGLLFTLGSLMFTLIELFGKDAGGVNNGDIYTLLRNFGIALISTICGITCRVFIQNFQRTESGNWGEFPPENGTIIDLDIHNRHVFGKITRELTQGANALARFHRIVRSHASDSESHLHQYSESLKRDSTEFKDTLQRNAETFAEELKKEATLALETVGGSLGSAAKHAEDLLQGLRSAHDHHLAEVREVSRLFHKDIQEASHQSIETINQNFGTVAEQTLSLVEKMSAVNDRVEAEVNRFESCLGKSSDELSAFNVNASQAVTSMEVLGSDIDKLRTALETLHDGTEAMTGVLDGMRELHEQIKAGRDTEQTAEAVKQIVEVLQTIVSDGAEANERAKKSAESFDALTQSIQTAVTETERAAVSLRVLAKEAEERVKVLDNSRPSIFRFLRLKR